MTSNAKVTSTSIPWWAEPIRCWGFICRTITRDERLLPMLKTLFVYMWLWCDPALNMLPRSQVDQGMGPVWKTELNRNEFLKFRNCVFLGQTHEIVLHHFLSLCEVTWYDVTLSVILAGFCTANLWLKGTSSSHSLTSFQNSQNWRTNDDVYETTWALKWFWPVIEKYWFQFANSTT